MLNISTATYIKKLVKIIYEKEKQIETLKKGSKNMYNKPDQEMIDREIRDELSYTSTQLKQVNQQINTMERSMAQLEADLDEQIIKNIQHQQRISTLTSQNIQLKTTIEELQDQINDLHNKYNQLTHNIEDSNKREQKILNQKMELLLKIGKMDDLTTQIKNKSEQQGDRLENELKNYQNKLNNKIAQLKIKHEENELLKKEIQSKNTTIDEAMNKIHQQQYCINKKEEKIIELNQILQSKEEEIINKNNEIQKIQCNLLIKSSQTKLTHQEFTNYKEFYYEINQYIESAYLKYCSEGFLQTSRRYHRQSDHQQTRFESTFKKMTAIQNWMEDASTKIQKSKIPEMGIQTIQNLSIIVHSFENKLQNCDLTQRLQKDRQDMLKNEQLLLNNLQKDCQSSYQHDRIKEVELDQMKEILKMTKEVNRELMDEINKKECVISECRKIYETVLGNKVGQEYKAIKQMLNIKSR